MKVKAIRHTETATIDVGNLPVNMVRDILTKNEGSFDGNWSIADVPGADDTWVVDSVEVKPAATQVKGL